MKKVLVLFIGLQITLINCIAAQTVSSANAKDILKIENYLGNYENIHPKVLFFENGWNGYEFWMAYTPYPLGEVNSENPCLVFADIASYASIL
ncbi:MAG: hypothetical protein J1F12_03695 [Muribaculaceae bacterium]|nr:hypothetical protein [Muribaculaceae bacterium]